MRSKNVQELLRNVQEPSKNAPMRIDAEKLWYNAQMKKEESSITQPNLPYLLDMCKIYKAPNMQCTSSDAITLLTS